MSARWEIGNVSDHELYALVERGVLALERIADAVSDQQGFTMVSETMRIADMLEGSCGESVPVAIEEAAEAIAKVVAR